MYSYQEHTLNENTLFNSSNTYEALTDSDMTYDDITLSDGSKIEFTDSNYSRFLNLVIEMFVNKSLIFYTI